MALLRSEVLNYDLLKKAVQKIENTKNVEVEEMTVGSPVEGFLEEQVNLQVVAKVRGVTKEYNWLAKLNPTSEEAAKISKQLRLFEKESLVYQELLPELGSTGRLVELEVPAHPQLVLAQAGSASSHDCLLLEDLTAAGFSTCHLDSSGLDMDHVKLVLDWLAKFHALGFTTYHRNRSAPAWLLDSVPFAGREKDSVSHQTNLTTVLSIVRSVQPPLADYAARLETLFSTKAYSVICKEVLGPRMDKFCTTCHGAPWIKNTAFWYSGEEDEAKEVMLHNYQQARYCQPATDLAILLYTSTTKQFRRDHLSLVLKHYHTALTDTLLVLGFPLDTYPFSQLVEDYQDAVIPAVGVAVTALPGLLGAGGDGTDARGDDCPGVEGEAALAEKVNAIMEELVQDGKI